MRHHNDGRTGASSTGTGLALVLALLAAAALAGCGGGNSPGDTAVTTAQAGRVQPLTAGTAAVDGEVSARPVDDATLFNWAQLQLPALFPAGASNQQLVFGGTTYTVRHYSGTDNYLGESDGRVFGYGAFTGYQLQSLGFTADYTCQAAPQNCQTRTGVALAWDGAGKAWNGSDWQ
jgi:hypothetical protein